MTSMISEIVLKILFCALIQVLIFLSSMQIAKFYEFEIIKSKYFNLRKKNRIFIFLFSYFAIFIFLSLLIVFYRGNFGLQILNYIFFSLHIFEVFIKVGKSERFLNWLGYELEENLRLFMMFIISLNVIYFLTRITDSIILIK